MDIKFNHTGNFSKTLQFLNILTKREYLNKLNQYGLIGVEALAKVTPKRTGLTAASWTYKIEEQDGKVTMSWFNTNVQNGVQIAVILDYGHGTGRGTFVQGRHYISPAIQPVFDKIADDVWKEVTKA